MAGGIAAADGLEDFDLDGMSEGGIPNSLVGGASAVAMDVVGFAGAVARGGTEATVGVDRSITDMDGIAIAPGFEIGMIGFDELINTALALCGDVLLELETPETPAATLVEDFDFGGLVHLRVDRVHQVR